VIGKAHRRFWKCFEALPEVVQRLAREKYGLWKREPFHPSLKFEERRDGADSILEREERTEEDRSRSGRGGIT